MTSFCPLCRKPTILDFRPFCSKRCADLDLARWFRGDYRIEGEEKTENGEQIWEESSED